MGCGIGVCFSCVQKVRRADGADDYVRVCKEGPIFDAKDILWNNDSKQTRQPAAAQPAADRVRHLWQRRRTRRLGSSAATAATLGAFVTKGVTLAPRKGNPEPRIIETRAGILNSIGLQNKGADRFLREDLPKLRQYGVPVIVNISANTVEEYGAACGKLLLAKPARLPGWRSTSPAPTSRKAASVSALTRAPSRKSFRAVKAAVPRRQVARSSPSSRRTSPTSPFPPKPPLLPAPMRFR